MTMPNNRADNGSKGINVGFKEDHMWQYREWRASWGKPYYAQDMDQVEYRPYPKTKVICPIGYFECTRYPHPYPAKPSQAYLDQIITRYYKRDGQAAFAKRMGKLLHIPVKLILFGFDMRHVWIWDLERDKGWWDMPAERLKREIKNMKFPQWYIDEQEQALIDKQILEEAMANGTY